MNFAHPGLLALAAAFAPLLALFFLWSWRTRKRLIREFVPPRLQSTLTLGLSPKRAAARAAILVLATTSLLLALARPRLGAGSVEVKQRGLDIIVGIDTSRSMLAEDAGPGISRLQRARLATLDLARLAKRDRLGLVAFAGTAFLQCPLTIDDAAFQQSVDSLDAGIIPQGGTALSAAIATAIEAFGNDPDNVRVLVLFTDGEDHESGTVEAAQRAAERGLRIFTVGVGSPSGEIIRLRDKDGTASYLKDDQGNVVKSALNESLLQEVASKTGGFYLPLQGARAMQELYQRGLEPLPRTDIASRVMDQFHERYQWPLGLALILLIWETLLPERARSRGTARAVRLTHPALGGAGSSTAMLMLLAAFALALVRPTFASPSSALREYRQGNYDEAQREYERLARSRPDDARYRFNAGSAAYRAGDFTNAVQHFQSSLASPDLKLQHDGFYNLGNAQFRLGENASEPTLRQSSWENAIRSYDAALKLVPNDPRTQQNLEFVRQRLDQLKQQQQKQPQNQKQDSKDKQDKEKQEDGEKDQNQQQDQSQQNQQDQQKSQDKSGQKDQNKPNDASNPDDEKDPQDSKPQDSQPEEPKDPSSSPKPDKPDAKNPKDSPQNPPANPQDKPDAENAPQDAGDISPAGQMTPKQALRLLDTARGEEKMVPLEKRRARNRMIKDW